MELYGKVALVTGAGSGIGRAAALGLARAGAAIGALGRTAADVEAAAREIEDRGGRAMPLVADIADADAMASAVSRLVGP